MYFPEQFNHLNQKYKYLDKQQRQNLMNKFTLIGR